MCEVHIIGQVIGASEFPYRNLFCKWGVHSGNGWKVLEGLKEGQTQMDNPLDENKAYWYHPIDIHYATKGIQGWPKFHFQVWHQDDYGRNEFCSYGFCHLPTSAGFHKLECVTWSPVGSFQDRIYKYFLGGGMQLQRLADVYEGLDRFKLHTEAMGKVQLEVYVVLRNFDKYGVVTK